jgi:hypothetical protein
LGEEKIYNFGLKNLSEDLVAHLTSIIEADESNYFLNSAPPHWVMWDWKLPAGCSDGHPRTPTYITSTTSDHTVPPPTAEIKEHVFTKGFGNFIK